MSENAGSGPGAALRAAREARGASVEDVAQAMHLPRAFIEGLEDNAFSALPAPTFTRGYIRSYAKLLGIDSAVLIRQYGEAIRDEGEAKLVVSVSRRPLREFPQRSPGWVFGGAVFAVALAVALILWWAWPEEDDAPVQQTGLEVSRTERSRALDTADPTATETRAEGEDASVWPVAQDERRSVGTAPAVEMPDEAAQAVFSGTPDITPTDPEPSRAPDIAAGEPDVWQDAAPVEQDAPDETDIPGTAEDPRPPPPAAQAIAADVLEFSFDEDCWVEVCDGEGRVLHMDMSLAGEFLRVPGTAPFSVKLGNAWATALAFNGAAVELEPHTRANVANLVLED